jgi:hypothetical protein
MSHPLKPKPGEENVQKKLSTRLRGAFSKETAQQMKSELELMRTEWQ